MMNDPTLPSAFVRPRLLKSAALSALLVLLLGNTMQGCENAYLDFFCALYTGTYGEFGCIIDCNDLILFENPNEFSRAFWNEVFCEENGIPLSGAAPKQRMSALATSDPTLFMAVEGGQILSFVAGDATTQEVVDFGRFPGGLALDLVGGKLYWAEGRTQTLRRANLDGSSEETLVTGLVGLSGLALDLAGGKLYWGNTIAGKIQRLDLNTLLVEDAVTGLVAPFDLALDAAAGQLYWVHVDGNAVGKIQRMNVTTLLVEDVIAGLTSPYGLALDPVGGKVYWTDMMDGAVRRANLDGTGVEDLITSLDAPGGLAVDVTANKVYWAEMDQSVLQIKRADFDGMNEETLADFTSAADLALDLTADHLYWTGWVDGTVKRASLDGSSLEILSSSHRISGDLALDPTRMKIYWAVLSLGQLQRANLNGTGIEDIGPVQLSLGAVAFDATNDKFYWTSAGDVLRSDPDGSNVETILNDIVFISDIELDPTNSKIYWINQLAIQRANLDGSQVETFFTDTGNPKQVAVDAANGKLYWSVPTQNAIRCANLDGTGTVDDVVVGANFVQQVAVMEEHLYWSRLGSARIQRSNLDGTGAEDILDLSAATTGLALLPEGIPVPVELVSFEARRHADAVWLSWRTASETNNAGFDIEWMQRPENGWTRVAFVAGHGTTTEPQRYQYHVEALAPGRHRFRLKQIDFDGTFAYSPEVEAQVEVAETYLLMPAHPNPFNPETRFTLAVRKAQHVQVVVYDALGREVERLFEGRLEANTSYPFVLDGSRWPSGLYVSEVIGEHFRTNRIVLLVK